MINQSNYFAHIERIGFENLPDALKQAHLVLMTKTDNGKDWKTFGNSKEFIELKDLAFKKLDEFILSRTNLSGMDEELNGKPEKDFSEIYEEVKFIERFLTFHDKVLYRNTFKIFIDQLQKSITDGLITKKSPVANEIMEIQKACIKAHNQVQYATHFVLKPATIKKLKGIIVKFENDGYKKDAPSIAPKIKKMDLSGLENISSDNQTKMQTTEDKIPPAEILCSTEISKMEFPSIGFNGKWKDLIGDPAPGFTAMVYGLPKMGKSYLCIDFAVYLAEHHGKVLYVAAEEKIDATLQKKITDLKASNPNLFFSSSLPDDLSAYDFIFLDSVSSLKLNIDALKKLKADNPKKSFVFIFQSTKDGNFRGGNEFQHEVDVVISIPEKGKAVQFGRFNQGGEMQFFREESLEGISKKDWTKPDFLSTEDHDDLKEVKKLFDKGEFERAMKYASRLDTIVRDQIPQSIWLKMGGKIIPKRKGKTAAFTKRNKIETELGLSLEELAMEIIPKKKPATDILEIIYNEPEKIEKETLKMAKEFIKEEGLNVEIISLSFTEMDSDNITTGAAYFSVTLEGKISDLKKIAGEDKLFFYEW